MNEDQRSDLMKLTGDAFYALSLAEEKIRIYVEEDAWCDSLCDQLYAIRQSIEDFENNASN